MSETILTAYHEAGHAVARLELRLALHSVSIIPDGYVSGYVENGVAPKCQLINEEFAPRYVIWMQNSIVSGLAGDEAHRYAAERLGLEYVDGSFLDLETVEWFAFHLTDSEEEVDAMVAWLQIKTKNFVRNPGHWFAIETLAAELERVRRMSGKRAREVILSAYRSFTPSPADWERYYFEVLKVPAR